MYEMTAWHKCHPIVDHATNVTSVNVMTGHNVSEMGGDLILAQNSMPQNLMKIELEVPGML